MKKLLKSSLAFLMAVSLTGCGGSTPSETTDTNETETNEVVEETIELIEEDPSLGMVIRGRENKLSEPATIYDQNGLKVSLVDSTMFMDGDEVFSICIWEPTFVVENNTDATQVVEFAFPDRDENSNFYYFRYGTPRLEVPAGEKAEFNDGALKDFINDNGGQGFGKRYDDYEKVPMLIKINEESPIRITVCALTIGGPYEDPIEVDYTGKFALEIAGEPSIRQTAKNPDYFTYCVDITFTNNSDETVVAGYETVAPGASVTIQSDIAQESQDKDGLNPHQTYSVSVYSESGAFLTKVQIEY